MSILEYSATELKKKLEAKELTSVEVVTAYLNQIKEYDGEIRAFSFVNEEEALNQAAEVDSRRKRGEKVGLLAGIPVAVKEVLATEGQKTTCSSKMLENFVSPYNATVVQKIKDEDGILLGRTNMDEFAMGSSTENSAFGATSNPWNTDYVPGGSSGGAAACVAADMAPLSLGTDTGGSIRQPAGLCGIVGLKPTYGRVSRYGLVAFASSLDQVGPMTRTVADSALLLQAIAGHDRLDSTSANVEVPDYLNDLEKPLAGLRLGVVTEHFGEGLDEEVRQAVNDSIEVYRSLGATISEVSLPHNKYGIAAYYLIAPSEASSNLARYDGVHYGYRADEREIWQELTEERHRLVADGDERSATSPLVKMYCKTRSEGFGAEVKRRIMLGTYALSAGYYDAYYLKALKVRRLIQKDYLEAFKEVDLLIGPVTPTPAFKTGEKTGDPLSMYLGDLFTVCTNLAGVAAISIPCGFSKDGLPIGLQLQSPQFHEQQLLRVAHMYQTQTDWHIKRAPLAS
ncbi:MAG: aspartyl/glutamyl-tRNA amidotransferase subunit A [Pirellulaceae bacterium]|nr:aspartyl/glutamyl-tRNA amidotransferase subunit A [Pirellulaceae bacterium]